MNDTVKKLLALRRPDGVVFGYTVALRTEHPYFEVGFTTDGENFEPRNPNDPEVLTHLAKVDPIVRAQIQQAQEEKQRRKKMDEYQMGRLAASNLGVSAPSYSENKDVVGAFAAAAVAAVGSPLAAPALPGQEEEVYLTPFSVAPAETE